MEFDELKGFLGDRFTTSKAIRIEHSHDESWHVPENIPDAITYPNNTNEVSKIISFDISNFFFSRFTDFNFIIFFSTFATKAE